MQLFIVRCASCARCLAVTDPHPPSSPPYPGACKPWYPFKSKSTPRHGPSSSWPYGELTRTGPIIGPDCMPGPGFKGRNLIYHELKAGLGKDPIHPTHTHTLTITQPHTPILTRKTGLQNKKKVSSRYIRSLLISREASKKCKPNPILQPPPHFSQ